MMRRFKVENPIDSFIARLRRGRKAVAGERGGEPSTPRRSRPRGCCSPGRSRFVMGAARIDQLPAPDLPEVAFAGRSNVGKSRLINALVGPQAPGARLATSPAARAR